VSADPTIPASAENGKVRQKIMAFNNHSRAAICIAMFLSLASSVMACLLGILILSAADRGKTAALAWFHGLNGAWCAVTCIIQVIYVLFTLRSIKVTRALENEPSDEMKILSMLAFWAHFAAAIIGLAFLVPRYVFLSRLSAHEFDTLKWSAGFLYVMPMASYLLTLWITFYFRPRHLYGKWVEPKDHRWITFSMKT